MVFTIMYLLNVCYACAILKTLCTVNALCNIFNCIYTSGLDPLWHLVPDRTIAGHCFGRGWPVQAWCTLHTEQGAGKQKLIT